MPNAPKPSVREVLLSIVRKMDEDRGPNGNLQQSSVLNEVQQTLYPGPGHFNRDLEEAILTQWHDLFRTGLLAWGFNLGNPNPPFFHVTERGRKTLANLS